MPLIGQKQGKQSFCYAMLKKKKKKKKKQKKQKNKKKNKTKKLIGIYK